MSRGPHLGRRAFLAGTAGGAAALAGVRPAAAAALNVTVPGSILYALDRKTGEERWSRRLPPLWNQPALVDNRLVAGTGEAFVGIDLDTGDEQWRLDRGVLDSPQATSGTGVVAADGRVVAVAADESVVAVDAAAGEVDWSFSFEGDESAAHTTPVVAGSAVYAVSDAGTLVSLDPTTGEERWRTATNPAPEYALGASANRAFVGGGSNIAGYAADDGSEAWSHPSLSTAAPLPTYAHGQLYISGEGGSFHTLDPATGEERWRTNLGVRTRFGRTDDRAYVAAGDIVAAVAADDGTVADRFGLPIASASGTAVADGHVHVSANDGRIRAMSTDDGSEAWATDLRDDSLHATEETAPVWLFTTPLVDGDTVYAGTTLTEVGSSEGGPADGNLMTQFALIVLSVFGAGYAVRRFTHDGPRK